MRHNDWMLKWQIKLSEVLHKRKQKVLMNPTGMS